MDVGSHCSVSSCHQVDFLPFECDCCSGVFCLQHRSYDAHACPKAGGSDRRVLSCPLCARLVRWTAAEDVNEVWEAHVRSGGCQPEAEDAKKPKKKKKRCAADGCRELLLASNAFHCPKCALDVCLRHRFEGDHACAAARQRQRQAFWGSSTANSKVASKAAGSSSGERRPSVAKSVAAAAASARSAVSGLVQSAKPAAVVTASSEQCPICQRRFQYVSQLLQHVNREHPDPQQAQAQARRSSQAAAAGGGETCPQCRAVFPDLNALIRHAEAAHATSSVASGGSDQDKCSVM